MVKWDRMSRCTSSPLPKRWDPLSSSPFLFPSYALCFLWHLYLSRNWFNSLKWQSIYAIYVVGSFLKFQSIKSGHRRDWCYSHKTWQWIMRLWAGEEEDRSWSIESEKQEKKKREDRPHTFSCREPFVGFIYQSNLCCGFMPLKTVFPIKMEEFSLLIFVNALFPFFFVAWRSDR